MVNGTTLISVLLLTSALGCNGDAFSAGDGSEGGSDTGGSAGDSGGSPAGGALASGGSLSSGGSVSSGGTGGTSSGGVSAAGGSGGTTSDECSNQTVCTSCCKDRYADGIDGFLVVMYGCGCADCYDLCSTTFCDTNLQDPIDACLSCMIENSESAACGSPHTSCHETPACNGYLTCLESCF
jgi:hypothetical protein